MGVKLGGTCASVFRCVEGADVAIEPRTPLVERERPDLLGGVVTVETPATAVPYFAWGNRGAGAMRVWLRAR